MFPIKNCGDMLRLGLSKFLAAPPPMLPVRSFSSAFATKPPAIATSSFPALRAGGNEPLIGLSSNGSSGLFTQIRTIIRNNFPVPRETKRRQLAWAARMKTKGGRAIIMRRILKGRHVLTH